LRTRRPRIFVAFALATVSLWCAGSAFDGTAAAQDTGLGATPAETRDHLKCYRTEDASEAGASVDLASVPFGLDAGCVIEGKVRELCVPATGDVVDEQHPSGAEPPLRGDDLAQERLCYRVACPKRDLPRVQVTDRFGSRTVDVRRSRLVCLPVIADAGTAK
jgi:hypothetical protein